MADSDEMKSADADHDSDDDGVSALRWTARRLEATDDDDVLGQEQVEEEYWWSSDDLLDDEECEGGVTGEKLEEEYRWSSDDLLDDDECEGGVTRDKLEEEYRWSSDDLLDDDEGEGGVAGGELEEVNREEGELREVLHVNKEEGKKPVNDDISVPRYGKFYMHDDRFQSSCYGRRRGTKIGVKLWNCTDEQKWKHDKFEDVTDKSAPKSYHQQQRKKRSKGHNYGDTNQFGSHDNFGSQNKTSRIVRGRGPVKYKPIVKSNNINPSSKHEIPAKLMGSTSSSNSPGVSSRALAISSDSRGPRIQQLISKEMTPFIGVQSSLIIVDCSCDPGQKTMQLGDQPYGAVNDHTPSMALAGHDPRSQLGSRNCEVTSTAASAANPCNVNKPLADRSAPELVEGRDGSSLKGKLFSQSVIVMSMPTYVPLTVADSYLSSRYSKTR
ncbi:Btz domain [Sesbania bispinosa]|nr:Btz domain [Sesbania bispinosa]